MQLPEKLRDKAFLTWILLALLAFGFFGALEVMALRGEEPRRALVAWEMLHSGQFLRPSIQDWPYYNKPPLFNWIIAFFFRLFGDADWVVRLPSLLAFLLLGGSNYLVVKRYIDGKTARWSTLFLLTGVHYLFFATVLAGELDLMYALFAYWQIIAIFHYFQKESWLKLFVVSYLLLSVGFLIKGLPSIAFQGLTLLGTALYFKRWKWLFGWQHLLGGLIGIAPVFLYFGVYEYRYGEGWLYLFNLLEEASQKSAAESGLVDIIKNLFEFPFQYLVDHLPWSLLLILAAYHRKLRELLDHPFLSFSVVFFLANFWLYWISPGTRMRYVYVFAPFFFTLMATLHLRYGWVRDKTLWILLFTLAIGRIIYNYTLLPYQQRTTETVQLYLDITNKTLSAAEGRPLFTCCDSDTILVDPSVAGFPILYDTILIPMYTPYQLPFNLQRARGELVPFRQDLNRPGIYLSTDTVAGTRLDSFSVWDDKTLHLFKID